MIHRLLEQRLAIFAVIHEPGLMKPSDARSYELSDKDWSLMESSVLILEPLQMATTILSGEQYPTAAMIYPVVAGLLNIHLKESTDDSPEIKKVKLAIASDLSSRFFSTNDNDIATHPAIIASALHPSYKHLKFLDEGQRIGIWDHLLTLLNEVIDKQSHNPLCHTDTEPTQVEETTFDDVDVPAAKKSKPLEFLMGDYYDRGGESKHGSPNTNRLNAENTIEMFKMEKVLKECSNSLKWWKSNEPRYPNLAQLAKIYLNIPGTSVASERIFSATGNIVSKKRAALDQVLG
ncbi:hypothetical protein SNE40_014211 [Patella caerulea]|uniref:HAT C-terminal dimerisation domain-containing protein n=2 Tax=Patella caerulea TaxID=87958 RepID=A0AAN8PCE0_PATCE